MHRRRFIESALLGALAVCGDAAGVPVATGKVGNGVAGFVVGQRFRSACGRSLELVEIQAQPGSSRCTAYRLRFEGDACVALREGTHWLDGPRGPTALFLQPAKQGVVAWFNQLA